MPVPLRSAADTAVHLNESVLALTLLAGMPALSCVAEEAPGGPAVADPPAPAVTPERKLSAAGRVVAEARRILEDLKSSRYSHATRVDKEEGDYAVDCSGLATVVLRAAAPRSLASVPRAAGHKRPRALEFYETFAAAPADAGGETGWRRIERLADVRPGDLIAWRRAEIKPGDDTGHVVIVDESPIRESDSRYRVVVIDSTGAPHGDDTRKEGATGVGRGTMWFLSDDDGRPAGHRWKARDGRLNKAPIAIGRAVERD